MRGVDIRSILHHTWRPTATMVVLLVLLFCGCGKNQEDPRLNKPVVWKLNPSPGCIIEPGGIGGPDGITRREVHILFGLQNESEVELIIDSVIVFDSVRTNVLPSSFEGLSSAMTYEANSFRRDSRDIPPKSWRMGRTLCYRHASRLNLRTLGIQIYSNHGNVTERVDSLLTPPDRVRVMPARTRETPAGLSVHGS
jgi:hypothetical protein